MRRVGKACRSRWTFLGVKGSQVQIHSIVLCAATVLAVTHQFGDRATFAIEVGTAESRQLRTVDLWAAGVHLTSDDNVAFIPFLSRAMRSTAARVRRGDIAPCPFPGQSPEKIFRRLDADETASRERFWFMRWGEIVDNVSRYAYCEGNYLVIVFAFWRPNHPVPNELGTVFVVKVRSDDFVTASEGAADLLDDRS
jgi:hypothetical protein